MGIGYAMHERLQFEDGSVINPSFMDYKLPSSQEIPEIVAIPVEVPACRRDRSAPRASANWRWSASRRPMGNAIYDALKVRIKDLPLFPERVLTAIEERTAK